MMTERLQPAALVQNKLLAALPADELARWQPNLEQVELKVGQVLSESGNAPAYLYFPTTAIVSLLYVTRDGASSEVAVVGRDGAVGIALVMGGNATPSQAVVHSAGQALRVRAQLLKDEVLKAGPLMFMLLRYAHELMAQVAQTAACNRYHSIDQLMCRRLLMGLDRSRGAELKMTHELLANLLGVRREGVSAAAHKLRREGVIDYSRGNIVVMDRQRLQRRTAECR